MNKEEAIKVLNARPYTGEVREALETLIPELKESEDERIRKWIIDFAKGQIDGYMLVDDDKSHEIAKIWEKAIAYLEKQKEQSQEELVYRMNGLMQEYIKEGKDDAEKEHRFKCYHLFWDALEDANFFEQKEQKSEDLNQAARDYASGIVDKEDAMMCKAAFEAGALWQKEQKPNIELIQRSWYMEGYHDREFGKEPKWILTTGEGGPKHELNPKYGQPLTGQQVTEEQLHNLNEAIKSLRMDGCEKMADSLHSLYDILKTQRVKPADEQFPPLEGLDAIKAKYYDKGFKNGFDEGVESIKPAEWGEEDEKMIKSILFVLESYVSRSECASSPSLITTYPTYYKEIDWLKSLRPSWKPSEEQMINLRNVIAQLDFCDPEFAALESLYNNLKKL